MKHYYGQIITLSLLVISPFTVGDEKLSSVGTTQKLSSFAAAGTFTESNKVNPNDFSNHAVTAIQFGPIPSSTLIQQMDDGRRFEVQKAGAYNVSCILSLINLTSNRNFDGGSGLLTTYFTLNNKVLNWQSVPGFGGMNIPSGVNYIESTNNTSIYASKGDIISCNFDTYGTSNFADQYKLSINTESSYISIHPLFPNEKGST